MRVPENPAIREVGEMGMAAIGIDEIDELLRHNNAPLPDLDVGIHGWWLTGCREIVTPDDLDRYLGQLQEIGHRDWRAGDRA